MQEGADIDLSALPELLQAALTQEIANVRLIDRETLVDVVTEFAGELDSIGSAAQTRVVGSIQNQISSGDVSPIQTEPKLSCQFLQSQCLPWERLARDIGGQNGAVICALDKHRNMIAKSA